jgi:hypothetical protein
MPLNTSGPISLGGATAGQSINLELSQPATSTVSLNDTLVRTLANIPTINTTITVPTDFYGKSIANAWFMTIHSPLLNIPSTSTTQINLDFDNSDNLLIMANITSTKSIASSISQTGTVNYSKEYTTTTGTNLNLWGNAIQNDITDPTGNNKIVYGASYTNPSTTQTRRGFYAKFDSSTGNLPQINLIWGNYPAGPTPSSSLNNYPNLSNYFPFANGNFIISAGATRNPPPSNSSQFASVILNPSISVVQHLALPPPNSASGAMVVQGWNNFMYTDSSYTDAVIAGNISNGQFPSSAGGGPVITDSVSFAWARVNQTGGATYIKRTPIQSRALVLNDQNAFSFNKRDVSYNNFSICTSISNLYSFVDRYISNNYIARINKTTGNVEQTVKQYATDQNYQTSTPGFEIYQNPITELDPAGNMAKITTLVGATPSINIRYFNINGSITNTYSVNVNSTSNSVNTDFGFNRCYKQVTYKNFNYIVFYKSTAPANICILKIKSDGSSLASGLTVTAPSGINLQLNPITNLTLFSTPSFNVGDVSFVNSPMTNFPDSTTPVVANQPVTVTQANI